MPVYQLQCPGCGHGFQGMAFAGTRLPEHWVCPQCGSDQARVREDCQPVAHPLEASRGGGCPCCGGAVHADPGS
ncbi:MAG: FmdB family zinc ribbon protein [Gammaproteobacteria bacterium]